MLRTPWIPLPAELPVFEAVELARVDTEQDLGAREGVNLGVAELWGLGAQRFAVGLETFSGLPDLLARLGRRSLIADWIKARLNSLLQKPRCDHE